ncbi:MAG: hypothetical protein IK118_09245 [Clostridia bacterium]|nr:hypothetical protein [Clostridia bacterium]
MASKLEPLKEAAAELPSEEPTVTEKPTSSTDLVFGSWRELNENEHQRVCLSDRSIVETAPHNWDEGTVTKSALPGREGEKKFVCADCGAKKTETIPALPVPAGMNTDGEAEEKNGVVIVTKLPYMADGLTVKSVSVERTKVIVTVENNTGIPVSRRSRIAYKCYDKAGVVVKSGKISLEELLNGESCETYFYMSEDTVKILFGEAEVVEGEGVENGVTETVEIDGILVTKLPYTVEGLTVTDVFFDKTEVAMKVRNDTGKAIDGSSYIEYKCCNTDGKILKSASVYLENLNNGESCGVTFTMAEGTGKLLFGKAKIYEGTATDAGATEEIDGIVFTKLPYTVEGLTVNSITVDGMQVNVNVTNGTGKAIKDISYIDYKCYDAEGTILKSRSLYLRKLNNGESCNVSFYLEEGVVKVLFGGAKIYEGTATDAGATEEIDGILFTKLPYTVEGLTINSISVDGTRIVLNVTNGTGMAIKDITNIEYKSYDASGNILKTDEVFLKHMNAGESCITSFSVNENTVKVLFGEAKIYEGTATEIGSTEPIDGIQVSKLPYSVDGLQITGVVIEDGKVTVNVRNNTGGAIKGVSTYIAYKCYDKDGNVLKAESFSMQDADAGETCEGTFYIGADTVRIIFGAARVTGK